ncbi:MAG TPA: hypothetical protein VFQ92_21700 [Blastocatellia bacterium]|nr:hypothetical protein [Blastocatellia bacterium]
MQEAVCAECQETSARPVIARDGSTLCDGCALEFYIACAGCGGLLPKEESLIRNENTYCSDCFARATLAPGVEPPADEEIEAMVDEYIKLHAEKQEVDKRIDALKERLKIAASLRDRVAGAVSLRSGDAEVVCRYSSRIDCDKEKVTALEPLLGGELFETLFTRETKFKADKERVREFLSQNDPAGEPLRNAVRDAIEEIETPSLTVPRQKK